MMIICGMQVQREYALFFHHYYHCQNCQNCHIALTQSLRLHTYFTQSRLTWILSVSRLNKRGNNTLITVRSFAEVQRKRTDWIGSALSGVFVDISCVDWNTKLPQQAVALQTARKKTIELEHWTAGTGNCTLNSEKVKHMGLEHWVTGTGNCSSNGENKQLMVQQYWAAEIGSHYWNSENKQSTDCFFPH